MFFIHSKHIFFALLKRCSYGLLFIMLFACGHIRKIQRKSLPFELIMQPKDSTIKNNQLLPQGKDSIEEKQLNIIRQLNQYQIPYKTFQAKAKVSFSINNTVNQVTLYIRLQKDSILWAMVTGPLGIEAFRMLMLPDSLILLDKLNKTVSYNNLKKMKAFASIPSAFSKILDLIIGDPIHPQMSFPNSYFVNNLHTQLSYDNALTKADISFSPINQTYILEEEFIEFLTKSLIKNIRLSYSQYDFKYPFPFPSLRHIYITSNPKIDIYINMIEYAFNQPLTFPFSIPKSYKIKKLSSHSN